MQNRAAAVKTVARRKAEEGNDAHIAAPMPGAVSTIAVRHGQQVKAGDRGLPTLEAMKMETVALTRRATARSTEILVSPGQQIDARDLLMRLE